MWYKFGVSCNCGYGEQDSYDGDIGDGGETPSIDMLGNDLDKIEQYICLRDNLGFTADRTHELVGKFVVGTSINSGKIVSVLLDADGTLTAVVFEDPHVVIVE